MIGRKVYELMSKGAWWRYVLELVDCPYMDAWSAARDYASSNSLPWPPEPTPEAKAYVNRIYDAILCGADEATLDRRYPDWRHYFPATIVTSK